MSSYKISLGMSYVKEYCIEMLSTEILEELIATYKCLYAVLGVNQAVSCDI